MLNVHMRKLYKTGRKTIARKRIIIGCLWAKQFLELAQGLESFHFLLPRVKKMGHIVKIPKGSLLVVGQKHSFNKLRSSRPALEMLKKKKKKKD